ncbi:hypothetical protein GCM10023192_50130 [Amycolatopsis samaneae]
MDRRYPDSPDRAYKVDFQNFGSDGEWFIRVPEAEGSGGGGARKWQFPIG